MKRFIRAILTTAFVIAAGCTPSEGEYLEAARVGDLDTLERGFSLENPQVHVDAFQAALMEGQAAAVRDLVEVKQVKVSFATSDLKARVISGEFSPEDIALDARSVHIVQMKDPTTTRDLLWLAILTQRHKLVETLLVQSVARAQLEQLDEQERESWFDHVARTGSGSTPYSSVTHGDTKTLAILVQHGLDPSLPALDAIVQGKREVLKTLLTTRAWGQQPGTVDQLELDSALLHAVTREDVPERDAIVALLLDLGAQGDRILTLAALHTEASTIELLLDHGARDIDTALMNARKRGDEEIEAILLAHKKSASAPEEP